MKVTLSLLSLFLCLVGCSREHGRVSGSLLDEVDSGRDVSFGCYVLHVDKRVGNAVEGIRLVKKYRGGELVTVTAKTGMLSEGPDPWSINFTLQNGQFHAPKTTDTFDSWTGVWSQSDPVIDYIAPKSSIEPSPIVPPSTTPTDFDAAQTNEKK